MKYVYSCVPYDYTLAAQLVKLITYLKVVLVLKSQYSPGPDGMSAESNLGSILLISITSVLIFWIVAEADVFCVSSSVDSLLSNKGGFCSGTEN